MSFYNGIARRSKLSYPKNVLWCQRRRAAISSDCSVPRGQADLAPVLPACHARCSHCCFPTLQIFWHLAACIGFLSWENETKPSCRWRMCQIGIKPSRVTFTWTVSQLFVRAAKYLSLYLCNKKTFVKKKVMALVAAYSNATVRASGEAVFRY